MKLPYKTIITVCSVMLIWGCASNINKRYYVLNYIPTAVKNASNSYPATIRIKDFDIEDVYERNQLVYRKSSFQLNYDWYRVWAIKPSRMITDLVYNHLEKSQLVSHVVRRYDEGYEPDYELSGRIDAIEEYDSENEWYAHLALTITLTRTSDGRIMYTRNFDNTKKVYEHDTVLLVKEMSSILEYIMNQVLHDIEVILQKEYKGL